MRKSSEFQRFSFLFLISLALNLFLLPGIAGIWFWSGHPQKFSVTDLHPAEVKTVALSPEKTPPPKPKVIVLKKMVPVLPVKPRGKPSPHPVKSKTTQNAPSPHILMQKPGEGPESMPGRSVTQGTGQAGTPTLPSPPPSASPPPAPTKGETRDSIPVYQPVPQIPDSLRTEVLKTFVRASFDIAPDGTARVTLLTGSGSPELDQLTLETLRQWRWKPALRDGVPLHSVERLKIEFEVE